jgi:membrane protein YdbS with pleckstrin-like domain
MKAGVEQAGQVVYRGIWAVLARVFRVPEHPPTLPVAPGTPMRSFRPARAFLTYLRLGLLAGLAVESVALGVALTVALAANPWVGVALLIPAAAVIAVPAVIGLVALHLRYDTTWYVMTDRSLRMRRGIWTIHETTITSENVQDIKIDQGPIQRWLGIANVLVQTAGGGAPQPGQAGPNAAGHRGLIEGVADAPEIRDLILARLRESKTAGLGDEPGHEREAPDAHETAPGWTGAHVDALREIRDAVRQLATR